jgi:hypothetical protein
MPRMIDMIRASSVPATLMQAAARGALSVPPAEMIEILVHLANHNKVFGQQARMTLAGWEESSSLQAASNASTPQEVLDYLISQENLRPRLLPALLENPSVSESALVSLATTGSREIVEAMRVSPRVLRSPLIIKAVSSNPNAGEQEAAALRGAISDAVGGESLAEPGSAEPDSPEVEETVSAYLTEHAQEIAAEEGKPFRPLGGIQEIETTASGAATPVEETAAQSEPEPVAAAANAPDAKAGPAAATAAKKQAAPAQKKAHLSPDEERGSALQKISRLDIKGRIQLAMKGSKEDRSILIRDSTKLVALGVLESPKVTDGEVEKFASQKNVLEAVLRQIPMKRRFIKNYSVVRNLVANPRTPLDVSLGLMKNLLVADLKNLSGNKEVSDTIRKLATKMFKQKSEPTKKS